MMRIGKFTDFYRDVTKEGTKIPQEKYLKVGHYPVIDQGKQAIVGRWDSDAGICKEIPAIIFGDHTRVIKYIEEPFFIGADGVKILRPVNLQDNPKYLYYALQAARIPNLGYSRHFKALKELDFHVYSIEKQDEIVRILEKIDYLIEQCHEEASCLDQIVKSRFIELFGDAVDNPMGWEKRQLQGIVTDDCTISYGIVQTGDEQEEGVPVFRPVDIVNKVPKLSELKKTTEEISDKYKKTILKGRELLITVRANIADTCIVGEEFKGCNVGRGIVPIRTQEDIMVLEFLKYLLDSKHLNDDIKSKAKGITLLQLNMEDLREVELIIPPIEKQIAFVEFVTQVDKSKLWGEMEVAA